MTWKPTKKQKLAALNHIAYEIEVFVELGHQILTDGIFVTSPRVLHANAYLESFLLHARVIKDFFERRNRTKRRKKTLRDVLVIDYENQKAKDVVLPRGCRSRLNKDLAHLTYNRLDRIGDRSQWDVAELLNRLVVRCRKFGRDVVEGRALRKELPEDVASRWKRLLRSLDAAIPSQTPAPHSDSSPRSTETVQIVLPGQGDGSASPFAT